MRWKGWILGLAVGTSVSLSGMDCGWWSISGEALYLKPCLSEFHYAQTEGPGLVQPYKIFSIKPDYHWGFRLHADYETCDRCFSASVVWTYFRSTDTQTLFDPPGGAILQAYAGTNGALTQDLERATARLKLDYDRVDVRFSRVLTSKCASYASIYSSLGYLRLEDCRTIRGRALGEDVERTFSEKTELEGLLWSLGLEGGAPLLCGFELTGSMGILAGLGERQSRFATRQISTVVTGENVNDSIHWGCFSGLELRLGLHYLYVCDCWSLGAELGWQTEVYFHALSQRSTTNIQGEGSGRTLRSVAFTGPYIGATIHF